MVTYVSPVDGWVTTAGVFGLERFGQPRGVGVD